MATLARKDHPMPTFHIGDGMTAYDNITKEQDKVFDKLQKASNRASVANPLGFIVRFGVADGYAFYRVVKLKPLTLEFIPYGDAYQTSAFTIRGIRLSDIKRMIADRNWWTNRSKGK